jgi:hypothetical protein
MYSAADAPIDVQGDTDLSLRFVIRVWNGPVRLLTGGGCCGMMGWRRRGQSPTDAGQLLICFSLFASEVHMTKYLHLFRLFLFTAIILMQK